jgi:hypothetical protein
MSVILGDESEDEQDERAEWKNFLGAVIVAAGFYALIILVGML